MVRGFVALGPVLALTVLVSACGSSTPTGSTSTGLTSLGTAAVRIVASTDVYGDIAAQIAGDRAQITSIITDPAQDPHSFEANVQTQLALAKAAVIIENGGGYDGFVDTMLKSANSRAVVLNAVAISGKTAPAGGELNEHVWYDFPTMAALADRLAAALSSAEPASAPLFTANATAFKTKLGVLEKTEATIKAAHQGTGVAITEPVPLYLLTASGLINKTPPAFSRAVEEGNGVPIAVLKATTDLFSTGQVAALVDNAQTAGPETTQVLAAAEAANVPVVPVTETLPDGQDYLSWMTANLAAIQSALGS